MPCWVGVAVVSMAATLRHITLNRTPDVRREAVHVILDRLCEWRVYDFRNSIANQPRQGVGCAKNHFLRANQWAEF